MTGHFLPTGKPAWEFLPGPGFPAPREMADFRESANWHAPCFRVNGACSGEFGRRLGSIGTNVMENSLLIGLSRQTALRNELNVVANNLANINTSGFKAQRLLFEEYLMPSPRRRPSSGATRTIPTSWTTA